MACYLCSSAPLALTGGGGTAYRDFSKLSSLAIIMGGPFPFPVRNRLMCSVVIKIVLFFLVKLTFSSCLFHNIIIIKRIFIQDKALQ